jgi:hypothetical protein
MNLVHEPVHVWMLLDSVLSGTLSGSRVLQSSSVFARLVILFPRFAALPESHQHHLVP